MCARWKWDHTFSNECLCGFSSFPAEWVNRCMPGSEAEKHRQSIPAGDAFFWSFLLARNWIFFPFFWFKRKKAWKRAILFLNKCIDNWRLRSHIKGPLVGAGRQLQKRSPDASWISDPLGWSMTTQAWCRPKHKTGDPVRPPLLSARKTDRPRWLDWFLTDRKTMRATFEISSVSWRNAEHCELNKHSQRESE